MTDPAAAIARTPRHPFGLGLLLGCALGPIAVGVLLNLPDRVLDVGVRVLNKVHRRD